MKNFDPAHDASDPRTRIPDPLTHADISGLRTLTSLLGGEAGYFASRLIDTVLSLSSENDRLRDRQCAHECGDLATLRATIDRYRVALDIIATDGRILDPVKLQEIAKRAIENNPPSHAEL